MNWYKILGSTQAIKSQTCDLQCSLSLWNAKWPVVCCWLGIKFCEESPNVTQGMLLALGLITQFPQTPSSVQTSLSAGVIIIIIIIMIVSSSLMSLVSAALVAALPQSLLDPSFDKFFPSSGSFDQQFNQQQQQLQRPQISQQPRPSQQITRPAITSPPVVRYFKGIV